MSGGSNLVRLSFSQRLDSKVPHLRASNPSHTEAQDTHRGRCIQSMGDDITSRYSALHVLGASLLHAEAGPCMITNFVTPHQRGHPQVTLKAFNFIKLHESHAPLKFLNET